jgi:hypothetical protein
METISTVVRFIYALHALTISGIKNKTEIERRVDTKWTANIFRLDQNTKLDKPMFNLLIKKYRVDCERTTRQSAA